MLLTSMVNLVILGPGGGFYIFWLYFLPFTLVALTWFIFILFGVSAMFNFLIF